jgi:hypothetical protein
MARCSHAWFIAINQGMTVLLECEFCLAVVAVAVEHRPDGGHAFMFGCPRPSDSRMVSNADLQALGDWFAEQVGQKVVVHAPLNRRARRAAARR